MRGTSSSGSIYGRTVDDDCGRETTVPSAAASRRQSRLHTSSRLDSHEEHDLAANQSQSKPLDGGLSSDGKTRQSDTIGDGVSPQQEAQPPSRPGSIRSVATISRGPRPLEGLGKAKAMVGSSQYHSNDLQRTGEDVRPDAAMRISTMGTIVSPQKNKKSTSRYSWLWTSFKSARNEADTASGDSGGELLKATPSAASRKIQSMLQTPVTPFGGQQKVQPLVSDDTPQHLSETDGDERQPEQSPILIPLSNPGNAETPGAEQATKQKVEKSYSAVMEEQIRSRYTQRAQVEKQTLINPCNPRQSLEGVNAHQMFRWQHLFPRRLNQHVVKWRSMTTPACLPLTTTYLPSEDDLQSQWQEYPYQISIASDTSSFLVKQSSSTHPALAVMREMAAQRLAQGFQFIVPTIAKRPRTIAESSVIDSFSDAGKDFRLREPLELFQPGSLASGNAIFLSMSNQIHRISYDRSSNSINVKRYVRRTDYDTRPIKYGCCIWPRNLPGYQSVYSTFRYPNFGAYNWTYLDALLAGYSEDQDFIEATKYWRTRFVVVPSEGSPTAMRGPNEEKLSDEEIRLLGMDRLADLFSRAKWKRKRSGTDTQRRHRQTSTTAATQATIAPLRFIPTSLDPAMSLRDADFVRRLESATEEDKDDYTLGKPSRTKVLKATDRIDLVKEMYSTNSGLKINTRTWNRIIYPESFSGADFVTWLCREFEDVQTREMAVERGNELLREGFLEHVHQYHGFLDGHYFYHLTKDSLKHKPVGSDKGWFAGSGRSQGGPTSSDSRTNISASESSDRSTLPAHKGSRKVLMSRSMIIDVDLNRKSERSEVALLHFDSAHNPANGFNFQIHWLGTTARFIEDTVQLWTRSLERYGLRCIEAPINQIKDVSLHNPFQAPLAIPLALHPPPSASFADLLPPDVNSHHYFQYSLLRKFGFILDQEASDKYHNISKHIEIDYKSRPNVFDYSQFVHRSGLAFVQVLKGNEGFLWLDNRMFNSHLPSHQHTQNGNAGNRLYQQQQHGEKGLVPAGGANNRAEKTIDSPSYADSVRRDFINFCNDAGCLETFYRSLLESHLQEAPQNS